MKLYSESGLVNLRCRMRGELESNRTAKSLRFLRSNGTSIRKPKGSVRDTRGLTSRWSAEWKPEIRRSQGDTLTCISKAKNSWPETTQEPESSLEQSERKKKVRIKV